MSLGEEAARAALFGGRSPAATGAGGSPVTPVSSTATVPPSPANSSAASLPTASFAGGRAAPAPVPSPDDALRASLFAGGVAKSAADNPYSPTNMAARAASVSVTSAPAAGAGVGAPAAKREDADAFGFGEGAVGDDGRGDDVDDLDFDMNDLNLMEASARARGATEGGDGVSIEDLNLEALDEDLKNFAEDEGIREALSLGVDVRVYARQVDTELHHMEMLSIADYVKEADAIAVLFDQIQSCEDVLEQMRSMLSAFQQNLGGISDEIRNLQEQSFKLSVETSNRRAVTAKVSAFLNKISVPDMLITRISEAPVDEAWLRDLQVLGSKLAFTHGRDHADEALKDLTISPFDTVVGRESLPQIDKLRVAACQKLRTHFVRGISELTRSKTNMGRMQEHLFLRFAIGMKFLNDFGGDIAHEVRSVYAEQVGRYYADIFKQYFAELKELLLPAPVKGETLVDYTGATKPGMPRPGEGKLVGTSSLQVDPFTIAERINVLADANTPPILSHVAQAERMRFTFEAVWRSVVRHLMDVAVSEHTFFTHFFGEGQAAEMLMLTLSKTTMTLLASLEDHLLQSFDAPGMMLLVALTAEQRRIMEVERKCSDLGQFFDRVTLLLWPRFKTVLDANVASVRVARETGRKLGPVDSNAHIIAKRYAEFASSILCLHGRLSMHHLSDDMLPQHMSALAKDVDAMLQKLAADLPSRLAKVVFMVNNYGFMLSTGQARNLTPDAMGLWERAATHYMNMLSDAELETHFRALLAFTKKAEATAIANAAAANIPLITTAPADAAGVMQAPPTPGTISTVPDSVMLRLDVTESESVLREFNVTWRQGVKALHDDVVRYFQAGTAPSSTVVLKRIMTAFLNLYERFNTVLTRGLPTGTAALHEIVPIQTIYHEMKKYIAKVESGAGGVAGM